jgi:hypothetical protein
LKNAVLFHGNLWEGLYHSRPKDSSRRETDQTDRHAFATNGIGTKIGTRGSEENQQNGVTV